jgi:hypothetical protein
LVMSHAQPTGIWFPHTPTPVAIRYPMQKTPNVAALEVIVNATHHQRGAGCSTTPEIRSVNQLKLRRWRTSGTRASCCCASLISGTVGAASMTKLRIADSRPLLALQNRKSRVENLSCWFLLKTCDPNVFRVRHLGVWITNAREITDSWDDVQIIEDSVIPILLFHF